MTELDEKIEQFLWRVDDIMESHEFQYIGEEDYKYCNDFIEYVEISFEKDGRYVDISLKVLLNDSCEPVEVKKIIIDDDDNVLTVDLYNRIMELYKSIFS